MAVTHLLLVEGPGDAEVIHALRNRHGGLPHFDVKEEGGYQKLRQRLRIHLIPGTEMVRLGIIVDADADLSSRGQSVQSALEHSGYAGLPTAPDPAGTVVEHDAMPRIGVWIMPNNQLPGILEDFLMFLVPAGDNLIEHARNSVDE